MGYLYIDYGKDLDTSGRSVECHRQREGQDRPTEKPNLDNLDHNRYLVCRLVDFDETVVLGLSLLSLALFNMNVGTLKQE